MNTVKFAALLCALILLAGCAVTQTPDGTPPAVTPSQSPKPAPTPVPTPAPTSLSTPAVSGQYPNIPKMTLEEYPTVDGSTANLPLALALMRAVTGASLEEAESATVFSTTDPSYRMLSWGIADMLLVYEASDGTKAELEDYGSLQISPLGRDALVFLVNEDNQVAGLTTKQIRAIYSGQVTNWKDVGGRDREIKAFQRQEASGSQTMMRKLVMGGAEMADPITHPVVYDMGGLVDEISSFDASANAIGYSVYYYARNMYALPGVRLLDVDGVAPSNETIRSGEYPHVNEFFCVLPEDPTPSARKLADWLLSDEGQAFVEENGYVPAR